MKATKFGEIFNLLLSTVHTDKSKVEILQNFVALPFSEYMNFIKYYYLSRRNLISKLMLKNSGFGQ